MAHALSSGWSLGMMDPEVVDPTWGKLYCSLWDVGARDGGGVGGPGGEWWGGICEMFSNVRWYSFLESSYVGL